ncbi:MAG TPA: efflux RND transporter periplasmic adaptor subunit [Henriciella marina]|uniref:efflux RND transporter periplasmic adaptor subunit n=1 Tax=Henriciella sp. TaxID=1968823 RepID=UPI001855E2B0|nr:efflux RND transporter periplasmic adaptor subunit [Henriciella sp.]HIG23798.1 efflux RND transporter periplasmic adaptor subunit [Henriciella sp.]HIK64834.1 efflux RND transporter periplasmic adaptor subunit [Henriciella marina]
MALKKFYLGFAAMLALLPGCSEPAPPTELPPRPVETVEVQSSANRSRPVYSGTLRAKQRSDLSFLRTGQVVEMTKQLGESFTADEKLARIDNTELSFFVEELSANLLGAEAELADAQRNHDRLLAMKGTGAVSQSDIDAAGARLESAEARVTSIEASVGQARRRLTETVLVAPYNGQVVERLVEPSQTAAAGQPVYRVIGDEGGLEAVVNLPVAALELFAEGQETDLIVRPSGRVRRATVTEVGNAAGLSGLYPVTLALADASGLRPGLRVEVPGRSDEAAGNVFAIPSTAYIAVPGGRTQVYIVDPTTGRISTRYVDLGAITDEGIEVFSGLEVGERIVARGLPSLRDGEIVVPLGVGVQQFND